MKQSLNSPPAASPLHQVKMNACPLLLLRLKPAARVNYSARRQQEAGASQPPPVAAWEGLHFWSLWPNAPPMDEVCPEGRDLLRISLCGP